MFNDAQNGGFTSWRVQTHELQLIHEFAAPTREFTPKTLFTFGLRESVNFKMWTKVWKLYTFFKLLTW